MNQPHTVTLAAAQIWSSKTRAFRQRKADPERVQEHFRKYNLGAATYDAEYARAYGMEYLNYLTEQVDAAATRGIDLLLFPEFCLTPAVIADPLPGIARNKSAIADAVELYTWSGKLFTDWLCASAKRTGMFLGASSFTVRRGKIFNTGLLADDRGHLALSYDKVHMPQGEIDYAEPGKTYPVADTRLGRIGFSICYDVQFPEHHACLAEAGAEIVLHPSGGYTLPDENPDMGQQRLRVRASDHHCAIVYACFAPESDWEPRESSVISRSGKVEACIRGKKAGFAVAKVSVGGKRSWPGDKPDAPDREAIRRSLRRPTTYRPLLTKSAPHS
ncbi:MAG: carbon-nitrogen hydrolase family protein [Planctomycetota bacterium]|nr:carbon-nitrogen hydrolase family protein [Planctomycetota bacterium]